MLPQIDSNHHHHVPHLLHSLHSLPNSCLDPKLFLQSDPYLDAHLRDSSHLILPTLQTRDVHHHRIRLLSRINLKRRSLVQDDQLGAEIGIKDVSYHLISLLDRSCHRNQLCSTTRSLHAHTMDLQVADNLSPSPLHRISLYSPRLALRMRHHPLRQ